MSRSFPGNHQHAEKVVTFPLLSASRPVLQLIPELLQPYNWSSTAKNTHLSSMFDPKDPSMSPIMESQSFPSSRASTLAPSNGSISDMEKESGTSSAAASIQDLKIEHMTLPKTTAADSSLDSTSLSRSTKSSDEEIPDYPTGMKLGLIVLALCLSVFVMALGK